MAKRRDRDKKGTESAAPTTLFQSEHVQALGVTLREHGIDQRIARWAVAEERQLRTLDAQQRFAELCRMGCHPVVLAGLLAFARREDRFGGSVKSVLGSPDWRRKSTEALKQAADTLEELLMRGILVVALAEIDPQVRRKKRMVEFSDEQLAKASGTLQSGLQATSGVPPRVIVEELRRYADLLEFLASFVKFTGGRSPLAMTKYLFSNYVQQVTSQPHDAAVSALISEARPSRKTYGEVDHRIWRSRNYVRLDRNLSMFGTLLVQLSSVVPRSAT